MVDTGLWEIGILEDLDFDLIKISLKAFDIDTTVEAYRRMADIVPYPFHLGITEAGTAKSGQHTKLHRPGHAPLRGYRRHHPGIVERRLPRGGLYRLRRSSRPGAAKGGHRPGRLPELRPADVDVIKLANSVDDMLKSIKSPVKVAVMGCEVNGPGEAKDADVGIAAGAGRAIIFRKGKKSRIVDEADMLTALMDEVEQVAAETDAVPADAFAGRGAPLLSRQAERTNCRGGFETRPVETTKDGI